MSNKFLHSISIFLLALLLLQGCLTSTESDYEKQIKEDDKAIVDYISANNIDAERQSSGVYIEILNENNDGKQVLDDHVVGILYTMKLLENEEEIEVHTDTLNPLRFSNSYGINYHAIHPAGLNYEISEMRQGETFRFYVPSYQAFGSYQHDNLFDPYSNFIIDVELVEIKTEEEIYDEELAEIQNYIEENELETESYPNGLYYIEEETGEGANPTGSNLIEFHFTRKYLDGTIIETSVGDAPIQVRLNNNELVDGLESGFQLMKEGGKATFIMPSKLAFGKSVQVIPQQMREDWAENDEIEPLTKPYSSVMYEIELLTVN